MGFDAVDRQFRSPEIKPECAECGKTGHGVVTRYQGEDDERILCTVCYIVGECEQQAGI